MTKMLHHKNIFNRVGFWGDINIFGRVSIHNNIIIKNYYKSEQRIIIEDIMLFAVWYSCVIIQKKDNQKW